MQTDQPQRKKINFKLLTEIFITFLKISPITFGGGFAMIPVLETEMVEKKKWIEKENIVDIFAVSQSVPGAIAVNSSIFLGYRIAGIPGSLAAMFGMVLPTFAIIILLAALFISFQNNPYVQAALKGIRPTIVALIAAAAYKMGKVSLIDKTCWILCLLSLAVLMFWKNLNIIFVILAGAFSGIIVVGVREKLMKYGKLHCKSTSGKNGEK